MERFPNGANSDSEFIFGIVDDESDSVVGDIWFGIHKEGAGLTAFIEDFRIYDEYHRRGYGTQSLIALEQSVRDMGGDTVSLFVQAHNEAAKGLYLKSGFHFANTEIRKKLIESAHQSHG